VNNREVELLELRLPLPAAAS